MPRKKKAPERILEAALTLFSERSMHAVTTKEIAEKAGCSTATLHSYFKTKDELLASVLRQELKSLDRTVPDPEGNTRDDLRLALVTLGERYHTFYTTRPFILLAIPDIARSQALQQVMREEQELTISKLSLLYIHFWGKRVWSPQIQALEPIKLSTTISNAFLGGIYIQIVLGICGLVPPEMDIPNYVDHFLEGYGSPS